MGLFRSAADFIGKAAYLPVRGAGRIARGKFKEGFRDIGGGAARTAAIVGAAAAAPAALGALGVGGAGAAGAGAAGAGAAGAGAAGAGAAGGGAAGGAGLLGALKLPAGLGAVLRGAGKATGLVKPDGGVNFQNVLKGAGLAIPAAMGVADTRKAGAQRDRLAGAQVDLATTQADAAKELLEQGAPLRKQIAETLASRLGAGPRPLPNLGGLRDTANPFRAKFNTDAAPAVEPAAVPAAPAQVPAEGVPGMFTGTKKRRGKLGPLPFPV